jgi:threonylcarbamoyladenosine tRNA methylthiotransferase MtaB
MRRRYSTQEYLGAVANIRLAVPDVSITTDVIVGFPGETDEDFEDTVDLCQKVGFASTHVFPYSSRPGTSAAHYGDDVPPQVKSERVQQLIAQSKVQEAKHRDKFLGTVRPVLWESRKSDGWVGLTDNYLRASTNSDRDLGNRITQARLVRLNGTTVVAEVI